MRSRLALLVSAFGLVTAACSQPAPAPPPPQPDLATEERAIRDADARWLKAAESRDAAGEAAAFAADGVAYREHVDPIVGPAAYQAYSEQFYTANPKSSATWTTDSITLAKSGEIATQTGTYTLSGLGPKGDGTDTGKFVTVWKKVGLNWLVAHDISQSTVPEPPSKK